MASKQEKKYRRKIVSYLKKSRLSVRKNELLKQLNITKRNVQDFEKAIRFLLAKNQIRWDQSKQKYFIPSQVRRITGELKLTRGGFGFVKDPKNNFDVFIDRDHLNTAFDRDVVEVKLYAKKRGKNYEGFVTKILDRHTTHFVGTFHRTEYYGFVVPDNPKIYRDFYIPPEKYSGAKEGHKVLVVLDNWQTDHLNPEGHISEVIGYSGEPGVDVAAVAYSFNIPIKFPAPVIEESEQISKTIDPREIQNRTDYRKWEVFTIDPDDAKDFDDAVSLQTLENGNYLLGVHIADVSYYIRENSKIDKEALKRGTSVYLVDRVIPMLPEKISNDLCSLREQEDKLTVSCIMEVSPEGEVIDYQIHPSIINSKKRFSYFEVQHIIDQRQDNPFFNTLQSMMQLSKKLTHKRFAEGGIDFETPEVDFELDEKGFPLAITRKKRLDSHRLIEEFMLLANRTVATHIEKQKIRDSLLPFVYRIHEKPDEEKMKKFFEFLRALAIKFHPVKRVTSTYFQKLIAGIKGTKEELVIEEVALRSMMKAVYSIKNIGHFGLGFKSYTHFTSPIRRYPDLIVHRLLKEYHNISSFNVRTKKEQLNKICEQANICERTAMEAERESVKRKQLEYIEQRIGNEYKGIISGVMSFGIFVELYDTLVEGLIHIKDLEDDYYIYDEKTYTLIGRSSDRMLRLGDEVNIRVKNVNIEDGKIDFDLI